MLISTDVRNMTAWKSQLVLNKDVRARRVAIRCGAELIRKFAGDRSSPSTKTLPGFPASGCGTRPWRRPGKSRLPAATWPCCF